MKYKKERLFSSLRCAMIGASKRMSQRAVDLSQVQILIRGLDLKKGGLII